MHLDIDTITDLIRVPLEVTLGDDAEISMMLVRDSSNNIGYWIEHANGEVLAGEETDDERALFDEVLAHVGWA